MIILAVLVLVLGGLFAWFYFSRTDQKPLDVYAPLPEPERPVREVTPQTEIPEPEPELPRRYIVSRHTVVGGESFSLITGQYWNDVYLWPDLYLRNDMKSDDPDLLFPDEIVDIYNRPGTNGQLSQAERQIVLDAYIEVYDRFKALGPQKNDSAWTLLWCGTKYDPEFLNIYEDRITPADRAMALRYIAEEGYLD